MIQTTACDICQPCIVLLFVIEAVDPGGLFFLPSLLLLEGSSNVYKSKIHTKRKIRSHDVSSIDVTVDNCNVLDL